MIEDIVGVCWHKACAEEQAKLNSEYKLFNIGLEGYKLQGCYECIGVNNECRYYTPRVWYK